MLAIAIETQDTGRVLCMWPAINANVNAHVGASSTFAFTSRHTRVSVYVTGGPVNSHALRMRHTHLTLNSRSHAAAPFVSRFF